MTICERLFSMLDSGGKTAYAMAKEIGIDTGTTTNWKKRNTDPPAKYIAAICQFLGCSVEYLLTGQDSEKAPALEISENGRKMLSCFEDLDAIDQAFLLGEAKGLWMAAERRRREQNEGEKSKAV